MDSPQHSPHAFARRRQRGFHTPIPFVPVPRIHSFAACTFCGRPFPELVRNTESTPARSGIRSPALANYDDVRMADHRAARKWMRPAERTDVLDGRRVQPVVKRDLAEQTCESLAIIVEHSTSAGPTTSPPTSRSSPSRRSAKPTRACSGPLGTTDWASTRRFWSPSESKG